MDKKKGFNIEKKGISISKMIDEKERFIAIVLTTWHLDNLQAYIELNKLKIGTIIILPQKDKNGKLIYRLNLDNFNTNIFQNCTINVYKSYNYQIIFENLFLKFRQNRNKKIFSIITPTGVNFNLLLSLDLKSAKIKYIILDEGLGTYMTAHQFNSTKYENKEKKVSLSDKFKFMIKPFISSLLIYLLKIDVEYYTLFTKRKKLLIPNDKVVEGLKNTYLKRVNSNKTNNSKCIIFFKDFGVISTNIFLDFFKKLFAHLETFNVDIYLKKHPNDKDLIFDNLFAQYKNTRIIDAKRSGEEIVAELKPIFIVGGFSTVVFSSSTIFGIKTYSYMNLYNKIPSLKPEHRSVISYFYFAFKDSIKNLFFINSIKEIK